MQNKSETTLVVLGANGRLGHAVAKAAVLAGARTIAVTRDGKLRHSIDGVETRAADALDERAIREACRDADVIFNGLNPIYTRWAKDALPMARNVLAAQRESGALQLFPGNVYSYGEGMPARLTPSTPHAPTSRKGAIRQQIEEMFDAARREGLGITVLRAGDFYGGPVPGSWFDLVVANKIAKGIVTYPGPRDMPHAWAYLPDLAANFVALALAKGPLPDSLTFDGNTLTGNELHAALERVTGSTLKKKSMPWRLVQALGLFNPMMREVAEMGYLWRTPHAIDGSDLDAFLGDRRRAPLDEALVSSLAALDMLPKSESTGVGKLALV